MNSLTAIPLQPIGEELRYPRRQDPLRKRTAVKIRDLLSCMYFSLADGALLASGMAPMVAVPSARPKETAIWPRRKKNSVRRRALDHMHLPVGLPACPSANWINALMQFMLFIPALREMFTYMPYSLHPFCQFMEQYFLDVAEKKIISKADSAMLARCLMGKFPQLFVHLPAVTLLEMIQAMSQSAGGFLKKECQLFFDASADIGHALNQASLFELLIGASGAHTPPFPRQYVSLQTNAFYDLDAFIEHREESDYLTYLKIDGTWIQCADERILPVNRSMSLDGPLQKAVLLHYRRVWLGSFR